MDKVFIDGTKKLLEFIQGSPSCYHVVKNAKTMLEAAGFTELKEAERYNLKGGDCRFVVRNDSSIIAFRLPEGEIEGFSIVGAHTDSPSFKIKGNPEIIKNDHYTTLNVEGYGGMLMGPWFDRPLSVAGRAFVRSEAGIEEHLVDLDRDVCSIVNLAIHQNRDANHGIDYKVQKELLPIIGLGSHRGALKALVAKEIGVEENNILDMELFLYNRMEGSIWGIDDEFFSSPKIDDLQCAFSALSAICTAAAGKNIQMVALFDNEEVGSGTKQGALGDFLAQTIGRIGSSLGWDFERQCIAQSHSFMLSADNGHALHPDYEEVCDPTNKPLPNGGVLIKYAGNQKYTTDGASGARLIDLLQKQQIPYQFFFNNSNFTGGSTLGNLAATKYSIAAADIGAAQLAMHSPYETGGTKDTFYLTSAMKCFFENRI